MDVGRAKAKSMDPRLRGDDGMSFCSIAGRLAAAASLLSLASCATVMGDVRPFPSVAPSIAPQASAPGYNGYAAAPAPMTSAYAPQAGNGGGSIYAAANNGQDRALRLFQDNKAREVGDLLTVILIENTRAKTNAATAVTKDAGLGLEAPTIFGQSITHNGRPLLQAEVNGSREFNGVGDSTQSNRLDGSITVRVVENLGNGNLRVAGQKQMRLNQGDELVQIQGVVRIADISTDNRITSDRVGEAQIVYGGRGTLARSNAMGWLGRFFNSAAFPY